MLKSVRLLLVAASLVSATAAHAEVALEDGLAGAFRGCEEWILNPASWADGPAPFVAKVGLGDAMAPVAEVSEANLPPPQLRRANHYWRINSTATAGYVLVVSDRLPMCHITGGGDADLQPAAENVLTSAGFATRWEKLNRQDRDGMTTTTYRSLEDAALSLVVSHATTAGQRRDRVQLLATALYKRDD